MLREGQAARDIGLNKSSAADLFVANDGARLSGHGGFRSKWLPVAV